MAAPPQYPNALPPLQAAGAVQPEGAAIAVGDPMTLNELMAAKADVLRFTAVGGDALHQAKKRRIAVEMMQGQSLLQMDLPVMQQLAIIGTMLTNVHNNTQQLQNSMQNVATRAQLDHLTGRVDHLTGRVDHLTGRVDHLTGRVDHLTGRVDHLTGRVDNLTDLTVQLGARQDNVFIRAYNKSAYESGGDLRPLVREELLPNPIPNPNLAAIGGQAPAVGAAPPLLANGAHGFPENEEELNRLQVAQIRQLELWYGLPQDYFGGGDEPQRRARFHQWITLGPIW